MSGNMRIAGIVLAVAGNIMVAIAFPAVFDADATDGSGLLRYVLMLFVGLAFAGLAFRVAGLQVGFFGLFLAIALGFLWSGLTTDDDAQRLIGLLIGGIFLVVTLLLLAVRVWTRKLTKRFGGQISSFLGPDGRLTPEMQAMAQSQLEQLHGQGTINATQLAAMQASLQGHLSGATITPPPGALDQIMTLHGQGLITDEQLETIKHYWGGATPQS
jgi:hypothetical protein